MGFAQSWKRFLELKIFFSDEPRFLFQKQELGNNNIIIPEWKNKEQKRNNLKTNPIKVADGSPSRDFSALALCQMLKTAP